MAGQTRIDGNLIDTGTDPNDIVSVSVGDGRYPRLSQDNTLAGNLTVSGQVRSDNVTDEAGTGRPSFTNGVQTSNINGGQIGGRRNLIINGAMQVAQRGTSVNLANSPSYIIDRFNVRAGIGSGHTASQVADVPDGQGFLYSLKLTTGTAGSLSAANGNNYCSYMMESNDSSVIGDGTVGNIVTLSFWVKSSLTGVFGLAFGKDIGVLYPTSYTISSANTWEKKTITIPATTLTDFGDNGTSTGARIFWNWGAGSDFTTSTTDTWAAQDNRGGYDNGSAIQLVENSSATWQITGVQLEVGTVATPFEHRSYGEELALCQRYYYQVGTSSSTFEGLRIVSTGFDNRVISPVLHPVSMRTSPTMATLASNDSDTGADELSYYNPNIYGVSFKVFGNQNVFMSFTYSADAEL